MGLGTKDVPPGLNLNVTHFDMDLWPLPNFVQGDAHDLSRFADGAFDVCVMGDIHEHLVDPRKATLEAARVAKHALVMTIFEEWRLPGGHGQHIMEGLYASELDTQEAGYPSYNEYMSTKFPQTQVVDDKVQPHHFHINQFSDADIKDLVLAVLASDPAWRCRVYLKMAEQFYKGHEWFNWLIAMERSPEGA